MSLSMYQASVPVLLRGLEQLAHILAKGAAHAEAKKIDPGVFVNARLAPDMLALARQVQIASDNAKGCAARLAGAEVPSYADTETTFPDLQARIAKTIAFVKGFTAAQVDGSEDRAITLKIGGNEMKFTGTDYLFKLVLPNFYFHVTTAYDILRHHGVELGKPDYLGKI
jgi:uncharacterized protein